MASPCGFDGHFPGASPRGAPFPVSVGRLCVSSGEAGRRVHDGNGSRACNGVSVSLKKAGNRAQHDEVDES